MPAKDKAEITIQLNEASDAVNENGGASMFPSLSYEDGVKAALEWVLGHAATPPMEE